MSCCKFKDLPKFACARVASTLEANPRSRYKSIKEPVGAGIRRLVKQMRADWPLFCKKGRMANSLRCGRDCVPICEASVLVLTAFIDQKFCF